MALSIVIYPLSISYAQSVALTDGWKVQSSQTKKSYKAQVPSTIMGTLTQNGLYKGILEGLN